MDLVESSTRLGNNLEHASEFINYLLHAYASKYYDPVKAHEYYERTKELKGRRSGAGLNANQKKAFDYSKSEIQKAKTADTEKARAEREAMVEAIREIAQERRAEIAQKLRNIIEQLSQSREAVADEINENKRTKINAINTQLKTDLEKISDKQSKDLSTVAERKKEALAQLREKTQKELDAVPPIPKGVSRAKAAELAEERSAKLDVIRGDYTKKRQEVVDSFDDESDSIRQEAQNEKDKVRDRASEDKEFVNNQAAESRSAVSTETANQKNLQRGISKSEREELTTQVKAAVNEARNQYETLKQELISKYADETDSEYEVIKRTVR